MKKLPFHFALTRLAVMLSVVTFLWEVAIAFPRFFLLVWLFTACMLWWMIALAQRMRILRMTRNFFTYIPLLLFMSACAVFILLQETAIMRQVIVVLQIIGIAVYTSTVFKYTYFPLHTAHETVVRLTCYLYVGSIFLLSADLVALGLFIHLHIWLQLAVFLLTAGGITAHAYLLDGNSARNPRVMLYFLALVLFLGEFFWMVHFAPFTFLVTGLLVTVFWYASTLAMLYILRYDTFDLQAAIRGRMRLLAVLVILALLTAQWG